jgi:hypothetical protein
MGSLFSSSKQPTSQTSQTSGTSTTSGARTKPQSKVFKGILDQLLSQISEGTNVTDADRAAMRASVGHTYNAIAPNLNAALNSRGLTGATATKGKKGTPALGAIPAVPDIPGKPGTRYEGLTTAAANEVQKQEALLREEAQNRFFQMAGLAAPYTRPDTTTTTFSQSGSGQGTIPGPSIFDRLLGYAGDAAGLAGAFGYQPFATGATSPGFGTAPGLGGVPDPYANPYGSYGN